MFRPRVMPCLLIQDKELVKTTKFKNPQYLGDPINAVKIFNTKEVDELVLLDISKDAQSRGPDFRLIEEIATECFMPLCYGGGVRNVDDVRRLFATGIEKVSLNTKAITDPSIVREAAELFGSQSIIVSIDVKKDLFGRHRVYSHAGYKSKQDPVDFAKEVERLGAGEVFLNSVDLDGTMQGYDLGLIQRVSESVGIPVIACGGAGSTSDLARAIHEGGASAVAAGSLFVFQGKYRAVLINFPSEEELDTIMRK